MNFFVTASVNLQTNVKVVRAFRQPGFDLAI